jgi:hypothetical protein
VPREHEAAAYPHSLERPDASHWVHHDEAERVDELLVDFFAPGMTSAA